MQTNEQLNPVNQVPVRIVLMFLLLFVQSTMATAQTFDNPDAEVELEVELEVESEVESEVEAPETEESVQPVVEDQIPEETIVDPSAVEQGSFNTFVPSEDISEDYSVPFPVDI